ncbi:RpoE DNA-directed RNA polymerase specialized sigma subunit, sigma24 homolog [uncultured Caudovirales phage]|uniref:RpoE DNA-directed RNA polymerase specialized sigma subunit, sigma24 homolog n=1 Tax=uncultured Caudovirales phage TaxID=2100421 RepID=A0A6J5SF08_9CAUD|nr:RpoE DNA-directed RNA polymerase specialized sigma subunit, sigma24 homolog [uncultured Caudovirales phage]CAB5228152.1 RpoE DNA-directed RNA polymerase specialized sigma subunit, sigma24 homolog [uncultured Caudovirales phage]
MTNEEAIKVYEDNKKLLNWTIRKFKNTLFSLDEVKAIALEALIRSADRYTDGKSKLTSFAIRNIVLDLVHAHKSHIYHTKQNVSYVGYDSYLSNEQDILNIQIDLDYLLNTLPSRWRDIVLARHIEGISLKEAAVRFGITFQRVAEIEKLAMKKLQDKVKG